MTRGTSRVRLSHDLAQGPHQATPLSLGCAFVAFQKHLENAYVLSVWGVKTRSRPEFDDGCQAAIASAGR
jgi:hypothetical protein